MVVSTFNFILPYRAGRASQLSIQENNEEGDFAIFPPRDAVLNEVTECVS